MAPPGESVFSTEWFSSVVTSCPHFYDWRILETSAGFGFNPDRVQPMLMFIPYFFFWLIVRKMSKSVFTRLAAFFGVKKRSVQEKFAYQLWLALYYGSSTLLGIWGYKDEDWFQFPVGSKACSAMFDNWPPTPTPFMDFAYQYQLGFYFAELYAIFTEKRRSDFMEYVVHHVATIFLIAFSNIDLQMRVGGYVFFIHDFADVFLCLAKSCHYLKKEAATNVLFTIFFVSFIGTRLISLPSSSYCIFCWTGSFKSMPFTHIYKMISIVLGVVLQALHLFWFVLVLKMVFRLITGVKGDVRSDDDDEDESDQGRKSKKVEDKKKK